MQKILWLIGVVAGVWFLLYGLMLVYALTYGYFSHFHRSWRESLQRRKAGSGVAS